MNKKQNLQESTEQALTIPVVVCSVVSNDGTYKICEVSNFSGGKLSKAEFSRVIDWLNKEKEKYPDVFS